MDATETDALLEPEKGIAKENAATALIVHSPGLSLLLGPDAIPVFQKSSCHRALPAPLLEVLDAYDTIVCGVNRAVAYEN
jgi:hypothetical protein